MNRWTTGCVGLRAAFLVLAIALLPACGSSGDDGRQPPAATSVALLAGTQEVGGAGQVDGPTAQARLRMPQALAVADDGSVYIGQIDHIRRLDPQGQVSTVYTPGAVAGGGTRPDGFSGDMGALAIGPDGALHVVAQWAANPADGGAVTERRPVVLRLSADGKASVTADPATDGVQGVGGGLWLSSLAFDSQGRLWLGDAVGCRLWRVDTPGARWTLQRRTQPAGSACAGFANLQWGVVGLAADASGGVVYLLANGEVHRLRPDGSEQLLGLAAAGFGLTNRLALDRAGHVWLADTGNHRVLRLQADGRLDVMAGLAGQQGWFDGAAGEARLNLPAALAVAADGAVLVADSGNHTVRRVDDQGLVSTLVGLAAQVAWRDGSGDLARFGGQLHLAALPDGSLRVSDPFNSAVRTVDGAGQVRTLTGSPQRCCWPRDGSADEASFILAGPLLPTADGGVLMGDLGQLRNVSVTGTVSTSTWPALPGFITALAGTAARPMVAYGDVGCALEGPCSSYFGIARADGRGGWQTLLQSDASWAEAIARSDGIGALVEGDGGDLFFALGHDVYRRRADGSVSTLARFAVKADGVIFSGITGLARDAAGRLYVSDGDNDAVRVITTDGRVHTLASVPEPGSLALVPGGLVVASRLALMKITF